MGKPHCPQVKVDSAHSREGIFDELLSELPQKSMVLLENFIIFFFSFLESVVFIPQVSYLYDI